jgi:hypothetical protein
MRKTVDSGLRSLLAGVLLLWTAPAHAQFQPRMVPEDYPVPAEVYHVEGFGALWNPGADMSMSSESLGIPGTTIDFKQDLGLTDKRLGEVRLVLRPSRKHKFRFQYIPIQYTQSAVVQRDLIFNGQLFQANLPVNSVLDWKAYRFSYEFDFLAKETWYAGFVLDFKQTDLRATLTTPIVEEFRRYAGPVPALGGTFRIYPIPAASITGEVTVFRLPKNLIANTEAQYVDVDFYGTYNFNRFIGAQIGYRSLDLGYTDRTFIGDLKLKGIFFGAVARY